MLPTLPVLLATAILHTLPALITPPPPSLHLPPSFRRLDGSTNRIQRMINIEEFNKPNSEVRDRGIRYFAKPLAQSSRLSSLRHPTKGDRVVQPHCVVRQLQCPLVHGIGTPHQYRNGQSGSQGGQVEGRWLCYL